MNYTQHSVNCKTNPTLLFSQVLFNVCDAFVSLGGAKINAAEIIKGISMLPADNVYITYEELTPQKIATFV